MIEKSKGGRPAKDHLRQNSRTLEWCVRWTVPPNLIPIIGKGTLLRPLGTTDYQEARSRSFGPNAECQAILAGAKPPAERAVQAVANLQAITDSLNAVNAEAARDLLKFRLRDTKPRGPVQFETIITAWAREKQPRESSLAPYRSVMNQLSRWLGHSDAERVAQEGRPKLNLYKAHLLDKSANATVKNHILILKGLFKFAAKNDLITSDPAAELEIPNVESDKRAFTPDERRKILMAARDAEPLVRYSHWVSAFSGCRLEEIAAAMTSDFRQEGDILILNIPKERAKNGIARDVPLHSAVVRHEGFLDYLGSQAPGLLFSHCTTNHSRMVNKLIRQIGINDPNVSYHCHRHTFYSFANELMEDENPRIPEKYAEAIAGHSSGRASRKYGAISLKTLASMVERIPCPDFGTALN